MFYKHKWRVSIYKGLSGLTDRVPELFDEVHVESNVELTDDQITTRALENIVYPKSHNVKITKIR